MHLAMGFMEEHALLWSIHVEKGIRPEEIAQALQKASASGCCRENQGFWPDQIFMIANEKDGPIVFDRYVAGGHYPKYDPWGSHVDTE